MNTTNRMTLEQNKVFSRVYRAVMRLALLLLLLVFASCSTVKSKRVSSAVTEAGIESARELEGMAYLLELPVAVVDSVANQSISLLRIGERYSKKDQNDDAASSFLRAAVESRD